MVHLQFRLAEVCRQYIWKRVVKDEVDGTNVVDAEKRDESGGCRETLPTRTDAALSTTAKGVRRLRRPCNVRVGIPIATATGSVQH